MSTAESVGPAELLAQIGQMLEAGGYQRVATLNGAGLFEDSHSIVWAQSYDSIAELIQAWPEAQGALSELISGRLDRLAPKAWDGYLLLAATGQPNGREANDLTAIEYDVSRVRKVLVNPVIGDLEEIRTALRPVLPLSLEGQTDSDDVKRNWVSSLEPALQAHGLETGPTRALLEAYEANRPLMDSIFTELSKESGATA